MKAHIRAYLPGQALDLVALGVTFKPASQNQMNLAPRSLPGDL
jgi:hypothetical protein